MKDYLKIGLDGLKGATKGSVVASASSIVSGYAMVDVPVKVLGLVTVGTSTAVSAPIVLTFAATGAVLCGTITAYSSYKAKEKVHKDFEEAMNG